MFDYRNLKDRVFECLNYLGELVFASSNDTYNFAFANSSRYSPGILEDKLDNSIMFMSGGKKRQGRRKFSYKHDGQKTISVHFSGNGRGRVQLNLESLREEAKKRGVSIRKLLKMKGASKQESSRALKELH